MSLEDDILIELFLKGELSQKEESAFSERLSADAEFREKVNFEKQLFETLNEENWSFAESGSSQESEEYKTLFKSDEVNAIKETIANANDHYQKREKSKKLKKWLLYPIAATVTFFIAFYLLNPSSKTTQELYVSYLEKSEAPSFKTRGEENVPQGLIVGQSYFDNEEYQKAEASFSQILNSGYENGTLYINLAISQMKLELYAKAETTLDQLIQSDLIDGEKGYWYKSLLFLASHEIDQAKAILKNIVNKLYFNHEMAKELLEELK